MTVGRKADLLAQFHPAVHNAGEDNHAAVWIKPGIENQGAQWRIDIAARVRNLLDDGLQNFVDADALLGAAQNGFGGVDPDNVLNLLADALGLGGREVDLVDDRDDFEVVVQGEVGIGHRLRLDTLGGIDHKQRAFAGLEAARDFVGEIHVPGRVDQVQLVHEAIVGLVVETDGMSLDGDAALTLEIHGVEHLFHHFALLERAGCFQKTVSDGAFAVVDVGDDGEISDEFADHAARGGP